MLPQYHFIRKLIVIAFACVVFGTVYIISGFSPFTFGFFGRIITINISTNREVIPYMGIMLMVTLVYIELLIIRDHLWVIEGSSREAIKWRDTFFNRTTLKKQKIRKLIVVIFSLVVFSWIYFKTKGSDVYSFLGIILMITVLYFEILSIRDDLKILCECFKSQAIENDLLKKIDSERIREVSNLIEIDQKDE